MKDVVSICLSNRFDFRFFFTDKRRKNHLKTHKLQIKINNR